MLKIVESIMDKKMDMLKIKFMSKAQLKIYGAGEEIIEIIIALKTPAVLPKFYLSLSGIVMIFS